MTILPSKSIISEIEVSYKPKRSHHPKINSSDDAYYHFLKFFPEETIALNERFCVGYLNRANRLTGIYEISKGGITGTIVDIRLIMSVALKTAATSIILAHNHPSGNVQPSQTDKNITQQIKEACKLFDISILDHLIVSSDGLYFSFLEEGLL